jgi:hypothetical protein
MAPGASLLSAAASNSCWRLQLKTIFGDNVVKYNTTGETSGATPIAAGAALLMLCKDNDLSPVEIDSLLETTAVGYSANVKDPEMGSGTINALAAVNATEFFNHFNGMFNVDTTTAPPFSLVARNAEESHWKSHPEQGTSPGQWRFKDTNPQVGIDGVLEGEAPLSKRSLTTVHHNRSSYRMDCDYKIKSFPSGGGHSNPSFGAMLRYDPATNRGIFVRSEKPSSQPTKFLIAKEEGAGLVTIASVNVPWNWSIDVPYAWHLWDDGSTITLTIDRPGVPGEIIFNHVSYLSGVDTQRKGLFINDGTKIQFDNVRDSAPAFRSSLS